MKVVVFGGRDFNKRDLGYRALDKLHETYSFTLVIEGGATGADRIGQEWAKSRGVPLKTMKADWNDLTHPDALIKTNRYGKEYDARAGFRRNEEMADYPPDMGVQFPGGPGTANMRSLLDDRNIDVKKIVPMGA